MHHILFTLKDALTISPLTEELDVKSAAA